MEDEYLSGKEVEPPSQEDEPPSSPLYGRSAVHGGLAEAPVLQGLPVQDGLTGRGRGVPSFKTSRRTREFRLKYFPKATNEDWNDWRWQFRNRVRDAKSLGRIVRLSDDELAALGSGCNLPLGITPYYLSLIDPFDPSDPVRRTMVPTVGELTRLPGEADDPLGEDGHSPVPGLVHRYPDRVLFLVSGVCAAFCRYCTRSRMFSPKRAQGFNIAQWERAIAYIEATPTVRDVLLSGGDPLMLTDEKIEWLLSRLRKIPHVEMLRIGTKTPAVLPQRITPALTRMLRRYHPLYMSLHFTHPDELTPETAQACNRLADAGIPLGSQTVLLKGVNDDVPTMTRLVQGLLRVRVRPYYLYQCDPISGSAHFRTGVSAGLDIIRGLRGHTSGYAVPSYVIDAPGGGGKIPLLPDYTLGRDGSDLLLVNYESNTYRYPDAAGMPEPRKEGAAL